jgi:hypothetical protein
MDDPFVNMNHFSRVFPYSGLKEIFLLRPSDFPKYIKYLSTYGIIFPPVNVLSDFPSISHKEIISLLFLELTNRLKLIDRISRSIAVNSPFPQNFFAITLVQSCCALLFVDLEIADQASIAKFLEDFRFGINCLPDDRQLCVDVFVHFFASIFHLRDTRLMIDILTKVETVSTSASTEFDTHSPLLIKSTIFLLP